MKQKIMTTLSAIAMCGLLISCAATTSQSEPPKPKEPERVLVFSKTTGFRHGSIEPGIQAVKDLGAKNGFEVDATEDSTVFTDDNLKRYKAVIFLCTTGDVLDDTQQASFERFIKAGNGYVGTHSATDTEYKWPWYNKLAGAYFAGHGAVTNATVIKVAPFGTATLPEPWVRKDEWYNFKEMSTDLKVIMKLDTSTFKGSKHTDNHPISWYQEFDGGRAFYTGMGHTKETFAEPAFLDHLMDGINFAMGRDKKKGK